jgi:uncharacterized membrane protein
MRPEDDLGAKIHKREDYEKAHQFSSNNRRQIYLSDSCGCFFCLATFSPEEIQHWTDENELGVGQTARCPQCGNDSVLSSAAGFPLTNDFLTQMQSHFFGETLKHDGNVVMAGWARILGGIFVLLLATVLSATSVGLLWGLTKERSVLLAVLALITVYCAAKALEWGIRMILNKPSPEGGLLTSGTLRISGYVTLAFPFFGIFSGGFNKPFPSILAPIGIAIFYCVLGFSLLSLAKARSRKKSPPSSQQ